MERYRAHGAAGSGEAVVPVRAVACSAPQHDPSVHFVTSIEASA